jgi:hypothetical protein
MKRNKTNCRHARAYPTIIQRISGFMWCPDCGAHRLINCSGATFTYAHRGWIYPTGLDDVCQQLEMIDKKDKDNEN